MSENKIQATGGVGFGGLLTLLFIGLKLGGVIDWSWWWVLAPLWLPLALILGVLCAVVIIWCLAATAVVIFEKKKPIITVKKNKFRGL